MDILHGTTVVFPNSVLELWVVVVQGSVQRFFRQSVQKVLKSLVWVDIGISLLAGFRLILSQHGTRKWECKEEDIAEGMHRQGCIQ